VLENYFSFSIALSALLTRQLITLAITIRVPIMIAICVYMSGTEDQL
jgi:hypothetical protein